MGVMGDERDGVFCGGVIFVCLFVCLLFGYCDLIKVSLSAT